MLFDGCLNERRPSKPLNSDLFQNWTNGRRVLSLGSNAGSPELPFQSWKRFKEAFAPELVARAVRESDIPVRKCLDPFGGSGTTALACQFLGVAPITIEVNPYLADLIEAKLAQYDDLKLEKLAQSIFADRSKQPSNELQSLIQNGPPTLIEPGIKGRFVFFRDVARRILAYRAFIDQIDNPIYRRLFSALLGGICIEVSNVTISGKGRRYRREWHTRHPTPSDLDRLFRIAIKKAILDIQLWRDRYCVSYTLLRGDSRNLLKDIFDIDLAVFSPPYPNSFDYTDIYNVELWMIGYLRSYEDNVVLRTSTLSSHVQLKRFYHPSPEGSVILDRTIRRLNRMQDALWHNDIVPMIGSYFFELTGVLDSLKERLVRKGRVYMVLGDSRYLGIAVRSAAIMQELAAAHGIRCLHKQNMRSMRASPQQGGMRRLGETLLIFSS